MVKNACDAVKKLWAYSEFDLFSSEEKGTIATCILDSQDWFKWLDSLIEYQKDYWHELMQSFRRDQGQLYNVTKVLQEHSANMAFKGKIIDYMHSNLPKQYSNCCIKGVVTRVSMASNITSNGPDKYNVLKAVVEDSNVWVLFFCPFSSFNLDTNIKLIEPQDGKENLESKGNQVRSWTVPLDQAVEKKKLFHRLKDITLS